MQTQITQKSCDLSMLQLRITSLQRLDAVPPYWKNATGKPGRISLRLLTSHSCILFPSPKEMIFDPFLPVQVHRSKFSVSLFSWSLFFLIILIWVSQMFGLSRLATNFIWLRINISGRRAKSVNRNKIIAHILIK